jgi:hypothetical protein
MLTTKKAIALAVALILAAAAPALGDSEFFFNGYSKYWDGHTPDAVGSIMEVYGILSTVSEVPTPIALDTDNYQYTVYLATMQVASYSNMPPQIKTITYNGGEVHIFADPLVGGTAADYADPPTFMDGELILNATMDDAWTLVIYDFDGDGSFSGSGTGFCDWIGGTQLDALSGAEYYLEDWYVHATPVSDPNAFGISVPAGFHRMFDTKITAPNDPNPVVSGTWGGVKSLFR